MHVLTAAEMRACDERTVKDFGASWHSLMERAGCAVAKFALRQFPQAARHLQASGKQVRVVLLAQLYRDRADADNGFDELKNQWGWGGFTTQDIERCQSGARVVALVYNGWSWYGRAAKPEAITSRALLLAAVGRATKHAGQPLCRSSPISVPLLAM